MTRVSSASVVIDGKVNGEIGKGFLILLGIGPEDTKADATKLAEKLNQETEEMFPEEK